MLSMEPNPNYHEAVKMVDKVETPCHVQCKVMPGLEGSQIKSGLQVHPAIGFSEPFCIAACLILPPNPCRQLQTEMRFADIMREAELIRTLDHPNIVTLSGRQKAVALEVSTVF